MQKKLEDSVRLFPNQLRVDPAAARRALELLELADEGGAGAASFSPSDGEHLGSKK